MLKKRKFLPVSILLSFALAFEPALAFRPDGTATLPVVQSFMDAMTNLLLKAHLTGGASSVVDSTQQIAEQNPNFGALIELIRQENHGQPIEIKIHGPSSMKSAIDFSNDCLKKMFGTAFVYTLEIDESAPGVKDVRQDEQAAYTLWQRVRVGTMPMLGFATTIASFFLQSHSNLTFDHDTIRQLMPSLAIGAATAALETQFICFSSWWNQWWRQQQTSFTFATSTEMPDQVRTSLGRVVKMLDKVKAAANWTLDRTVNPVMGMAGITRSHFYNYLVNFGYASILYTAGFVTGNLVGLTNEHFDLFTAWANAFWGTNLFFLSAGMFQIALGKMNDLAMLSEALRFKLESMSSYIGGAGRVLGMVPGMSASGYAIQSVFMMMVTLPTWMYIRSIQKRATKIGNQLNAADMSKLSNQLQANLETQAKELQAASASCDALLVPEQLFGHNSPLKTIRRATARISSGLRSRVGKILKPT